MVAVSPSPETAHPRSRGENRALRERLSCLGGSSPLARGKLVRPLLGGVGDRLIPARAGKTLSTLGKTILLRAHPRSRGEN